MEENELHPLPRNKLWRGTYLMFQRYLGHSVAIQSAALAFYLLFTIFPLLIFLNALLGLLHLDAAELLEGVTEILPGAVVRFANTYLIYLSGTSSVRLLLFGLFFSIYFPMRATNALMRAVRNAYHLSPPRETGKHLLKTLAYTVLLIVTLALSITLLTVGGKLLSYATEHFGLPLVAAELWTRLRFPVITGLMYLALFVLYALSQDGRQPRRNIYPGVLVSLAAWILVSLLYSFYVEKIASYSLIYGSIGTVIVLMIWLNLSGMVLIMGAELNGTLISLRREWADTSEENKTAPEALNGKESIWNKLWK